MEKYDVVKRIGSGSFGTAWLAKDTRSGNKCVIKKVPLTGLSSIEYQSALREGDLLASISHPSVCLLYTSFVDPATNELCLVSEFCARGDVAKVLEGRVPMPEPAVLELAAQIGLALMWLHRKRMLHRDIKPANIFIRENGEFSLGDFGIARTLLNTMAMAKTVVGTPYYLAPELCEGKPYSFKADVWSFGVVLFEAAVGKRPFEGSSMQSLFKRILRGTVAYPPTLSPTLHHIISQCLQLSPSTRPPLSDLLQCESLYPTVLAFTERCKARGTVVPGLDVFTGHKVASSSSSSSSSSGGGGGGGTANSSRAPSPALKPPTPTITIAPKPVPPPSSSAAVGKVGGGGGGVSSHRPPTPPAPLPMPTTLGVGGGGGGGAAGAGPQWKEVGVVGVGGVVKGGGGGVPPTLPPPPPPPPGRPRTPQSGRTPPPPSSSSHHHPHHPHTPPPPRSTSSGSKKGREGEERAGKGIWGEVGKTLFLPAISSPSDPLTYRIQVLRGHLAGLVEGGEGGLRDLLRALDKGEVPPKYKGLAPLLTQLKEALALAFDGGPQYA